MKPTLQAKLGTTLALAPQLQQAMRLLQLSQAELAQELDAAIEANPMLERADELDPQECAGQPDEETDSGETALEDWSLATGQGPANAGGDAFEVVNPSAGLHQHLHWQLGMTVRNPFDRRIGEALIDALDEDGYLRVALDSLVVDHPGGRRASPGELLGMLRLLQQFDPIGCAARDLGECLDLQLAALNPDTPGRALARRLATGCLDALAKHGPERIARDLGVDAQSLATAIALLRSLDPKPGARLAADKTEFIRPDAVAVRVRGVWQARMTPVPRLALHPRYSNLIGHCRGEDERYLRERLQEARWLLRALEHRGATLQRVAQAIVQTQSGFLEHGPQAMRPLTLRDLAGVLQLHESTLSRATTRKYLRTPRGVFEFRYFFGSALATDQDGDTSATAVQARLRSLIAAESPQRPLSDQALADALQSEGIRVARRTISKYREQLGIPATPLRSRR